MKIENSGITSLTSKPTDSTDGAATSRSRVEKKGDSALSLGQLKSVESPRSGQDTAEMSGSGRLLAKARVAMSAVDEVASSRIATFKQQIANGDYKVQVNDLARKLVARFYPK